MISLEISNQMCVQIYQQDWCPAMVSIQYVYNFTSIFQYIMQYYDAGRVEFLNKCFRVSLMLGELSLGELSCVQMFRPRSVSPEVLDQEQFACIISLILLIFLKT